MMRSLRALRRLPLLAALLALSPALTGAAEPPPAVALVVSVDVSESVDEGRFSLQMEGIAEALEDPGVVAAMTGHPGGTLFAMVTWADRASLAVGWRRIATRADALAIAAQVRATPRQSGEFTCLGQMFRTVTASVLPAMPVPVERIVVDVSGDGIDNCTDPDTLDAERTALLATGATINGLPILVPGENDVVGAGAYRAPGYGLRATPLPQERTGLAQWYAAHVVGGPGAFLLNAAGYGDFSRALRRKFVMEVSAVTGSGIRLMPSVLPSSLRGEAVAIQGATCPETSRPGLYVVCVGLFRQRKGNDNGRATGGIVSGSTARSQAILIRRWLLRGLEHER